MKKKVKGTEVNDNSKNIVASVIKACRIMEIFTVDKPYLGLTELSKRAKLNITTTRRYLSSLEQAGWIERSEDEKYKLTIRLFQLGAIVKNNLELREQAKPIMMDLSNQFSECVHLVVANKAYGVCIEKIEPKNPVKINVIDLGGSAPLYVGGGSLALLAYREEELIKHIIREGIKPFEHFKGIELSELQNNLAAIRQKGYSIKLDEVVPGVMVIGAPIFNDNEEAIAAISISSLSNKYKKDEIEIMAEKLVEGAYKISERMGYSKQVQKK
jgi:DNA-binding IclR family transcriptional regulator